MEGNFMLPVLVLFPMLGAGITYLIGRKNKKARDYTANTVAAIEFTGILYVALSYFRAKGLILNPEAVLLQTGEGISGYVTYCNIPELCGMGLSFTVDGFRVIYGLTASFMWLMTTLFSKEYFARYHNRNRYYFFLLVTLGATLGVFFSADFYTAFIFFEIMSFTSYVWVAHDEKRESMRAAETYLAVAVIGGLVMLMGIFLLYHETGTLHFSELYSYVITAETDVKNSRLYIAGVCILFGFGAKAGAFPLHIWLPKAHPVAPAPASALLSGILTKAGVFGILAVSCNLFLYDMKWGTLILIIGVLTMVTGAVLALFSIDLKRTLACSSVSQIGFILIGIGMQGLLGSENGLAVRGTLLHMVNHSLFKLVLFMAAGVVFMNIHQLNLNEIRGFGHGKPVLHFSFLMGALGIGGIPLFSGYISKTLLHESIIEYIEELHMGNAAGAIIGMSMSKAVEWIFLFSGGLTVAYMLKLYAVLFIEKNSDSTVQEKYNSLKKTYINRTSAAVLTLSALLIPVMGMLPHLTMDQLANAGGGFMHMPESEELIRYFTLSNLKGFLLSAAAGLFIYFIIVRKWMMRKEREGSVYIDRWNPLLDLENAVYRPLLLQIFPMIFGVACRILDSLTDGIVVLLRKTVYKDSKLPHELKEGTVLTHMIGMEMDHAVHMLNRTLWKNKPRAEHYEHKLALKYEELQEDKTIITRSMSFGLLLFCGGLILTLVYLLWK